MTTSRRRWLRSPACSKASSKRSNTIRGLWLLAALLLVSQALFGQSAALSVRNEAGRVLATVELSGAPAERMRAALHDGLKSEIVFDLRLFRRQRGFLAWLGDRPLINKRVSRVASFDPYTRRYVIAQEDRPEVAFREQGEFLESFLVLADYPMGVIEPGDPEAYYVLARVRLSPVRIIGPLNIVTLFSSESQVTTDWVELALSEP